MNLPLVSTDEVATRKVWEECDDVRQHMKNTLIPWEYQRVLNSKEKIDLMAQHYKEAFGDPSDPEYDAEIDRLLKYWKTQ